jgi:hypothetical protein
LLAAGHEQQLLLVDHSGDLGAGCALQAHWRHLVYRQLLFHSSDADQHKPAVEGSVDEHMPAVLTKAVLISTC